MYYLRRKPRIHVTVVTCRVQGSTGITDNYYHANYVRN